ncbi:hypothetical protein BBO99_00006098 [Phytophthora kernoviae]|uniref:Uncharacterized protein n=2 Tax=Phytophthora kernoviae TaxID=325452 RepID=A0A421EVU2_9STRA|nr:hypothetical protein G195_007806 [Phytophthora kernoviae 00238/432]KAG2522151.1 hypothetical protein JM16_005818 [Phytophthora kernoviae]KAG2522906.1 hypothetical protein JM18_005937 [Phytophthora kernoviae]RLN05963.1 hypothetical protein BBI17_006180 [Phytophthora kernoviae]RLN78248.1 hypothetical protein BBO99_00006098 [Phytophthora kernoviae]
MKGLRSINKTRTTDFSKGKVTRFMDNEVRSKADVPGPGEYTNGDVNHPKDAARTMMNSFRGLGPGAYSTDRLNHKPLHMTRPNVFYGAEPRFKEKLSKVPVLGPGQYNTDTVESDWNRPTHNISIATEMEMAMMQ